MKQWDVRPREVNLNPRCFCDRRWLPHCFVFARRWCAEGFAVGPKPCSSSSLSLCYVIACSLCSRHCCWLVLVLKLLLFSHLPPSPGKSFPGSSNSIWGSSALFTAMKHRLASSHCPDSDRFLLFSPLCEVSPDYILVKTSHSRDVILWDPCAERHSFVSAG